MLAAIGFEGIGIAGRAGEDDARVAARAFEAYFLRQVLSEFRKSSTGSTFMGGFAGATFQEMLDGALADAMATSTGVGVATLIERELSTAVARPPTAEPPDSHAVPLSAARWKERVLFSPSSAFGARVHPIDGNHTFHAGVDLPAALGTTVQSTGDGIVRHAGPRGGYGALVIVDHGGGLETRYAHLSAIDVVIGAAVRAGTPLGRVGATGRATGPHLHFEVRRNGRPVDPEAAPELRASPLKE